MIRVGVIGCDTLPAAELIRLLINHPDVELKWVTDAHVAGAQLQHVVPGIIGECDLVVSADVSCNDVDLIFLSGSRGEVSSRLLSLNPPDNVRLIDLSGSHNLDNGLDKPWKYGMSEMQRRVLVHDVLLATIPGNAAAASMLALMPLARNLLLNNPIELHVALGTSVLSSDGLTLDGMTLDAWSREQCREVEFALRQCQSSFIQPVTLTATALDERRTLAVTARLKCGLDELAIRQLYEQYYDDHNFVFMVDRVPLTVDIENTNKCLIHLDKDERSGLLTVHAVMDVLLKGSAGNAVHVMNLLFGLHERAGLALKGSGC